MNKYIYCAPLRCGFNDILCQIAHAQYYSHKSGRILVIDTRYSSLYDRFDNYFITKNAFVNHDDEILKYFDTLDIYPDYMRGRISTYRGLLPSDLNHHNKPYQLPLSFDGEFRDYQQQVIIHSICGDFGIGVFALEKMSLLPSVAAKIVGTLSLLGDDYDAIHVRNTDIGTDYFALFRAIFPQVRGRKLLVCSDDFGCREAAGKFFVESEVLTATHIPDTQGKALHNSCVAGPEVYAKNLAMLTDLLALARSKRLFYAPISHGIKVGQISGFSFLANDLRQRPYLVEQLLSGGLSSSEPKEVPQH